MMHGYNKIDLLDREQNIFKFLLKNTFMPNHLWTLRIIYRSFELRAMISIIFQRNNNSNY